MERRSESELNEMGICNSLTIKGLLEESHKTAVEKGWWDDERPFGDQLSNMHGELSEAWEEYRKHGLLPQFFLYVNGDNPKPEGIASEFADVLIRIFDTCAKYEIPLEEAIEKKMEYNNTRPYRHGNKVA